MPKLDRLNPLQRLEYRIWVKENKQRKIKRLDVSDEFIADLVLILPVVKTNTPVEYH